MDIIDYTDSTAGLVSGRQLIGSVGLAVDATTTDEPVVSIWVRLPGITNAASVDSNPLRDIAQLSQIGVAELTDGNSTPTLMSEIEHQRVRSTYPAIMGGERPAVDDYDPFN